MKLEWIKTEKCPECGETIVVEERIELFGGKKSEERRKFACGKEVRNNYNKWDDLECFCSKSPSYLSFVAKRDALIADTRKFLADKVSERIINDVVSQIEWHVYPNDFDAPDASLKKKCITKQSIG